jgi:hypothetical protein
MSAIFKCLAAKVFLITLLLAPAGAAMAAGEGGMCKGQPPVVESELVGAVNILKELMVMWPKISSEDEETIVRGYGLTSDRMNCVLGKLMAGNDIFNWGGPEAYGVSLSPEELELVQRYQSDSLILKKHLEENLNIKAEE